MQTNPDATLLKAQSAYLSRIIRSLGEKGALAEGDVQRAFGAIPQVSDTEEVAVAKLAQLREVLSKYKASASGRKDKGKEKTPAKVEPKPTAGTETADDILREFKVIP